MREAAAGLVNVHGIVWAQSAVPDSGNKVPGMQLALGWEPPRQVQGEAQAAVPGQAKRNDAGNAIQKVSVILLRLGGRSGSNPRARAVCSIIR
jgi:hypothetical protein